MDVKEQLWESVLSLRLMGPDNHTRWSDVVTVPSKLSLLPTPVMTRQTYIQLRNMNQKGLTEGKDSPQSRGTSWRWTRYKRSEEFRYVPKLSPGTLGLSGPGWDCGGSVNVD